MTGGTLLIAGCIDRTQATTLVEIKGLKKYYPVTRGLVFDTKIAQIKAVDGIDFSIYKGETLGVVGESGCGKTTITRLILLLEKPTDGFILFGGRNISSLSKKDLNDYRQAVQPVFQDPTSALNPRMRVADIVSEPMVALRRLPKEIVEERIAEVLEKVGLNENSASLYPHEFSGGQRQRIAIARALTPHPKCIILDEPVSSLDVSIRAQILNLLKDLQDQFQLSYVLIAHDLASIKYMSSRVAVMYLGKFVETADSRELYSNPLHPYTQALLSAALPSHPDDEQKEIILPGEVPSALNPPSGCRFHPRCQYKMKLCSEVEPSLKEVTSGHQLACHLVV